MAAMDPIFDQSPAQMAELLHKTGRRRGYVVRDPETGELRASDPLFESLVPLLSDEAKVGPAHEGLFVEAARDAKTLFVAAVHGTRRGQAQGGLRHWPYERATDCIHDALRLSRGMTRKIAASGLWWGGGKGIIARAPEPRYGNPTYRQLIFREYGAFVSSLRGLYVTAEDAGTTPPDVADVFATTRFATCIPPEFGGAGNPSQMTAEGVLRAMEAGLAFLDLGTLAGKKVVLEGGGHVGSALIELLLERSVGSVVVAEISADRRAALGDRFADQPVEIRAEEPGDHSILAEPCDVLAPCALGGVIGPKSIPSLETKLVCGAANNQLLDDARDGAALEARGITAVPDFIANRMGIVHCGNEQTGYVPNDPMIRRHLDRSVEDGVHGTTLAVLERARAEGVPPILAANELADEKARELHPIHGHRGAQIIQGLIDDGWENS